MPIVVMCGIPASGKTTRANEIAKYLAQKHRKNVVVINQQYLKMNKNEYYQESKMEKQMRGSLDFELKKQLGPQTIVIVDSLNYIKGFRYQIYCIARQFKTTYCVVYCNTSKEKAKQYLSQMKQNAFTPQLAQDLSNRMQAPQLKNRWDIPLFERREDEPTPIQQIANVLLFQAKKSKDPVSTKQDEKLSESYLYDVDKKIQEVCQDILMSKMKVKNNWSALQLKKIKKDFMNMIKDQPLPLGKVKQSFTHYIIEADKRK